MVSSVTDGSVLIIARMPLYLRRPVALILVMLIVTLEHFFFSPTPAFEWFVLVFFLKLVAGHMVREERYRP
jgi:hypothetical protein